MTSPDNRAAAWLNHTYRGLVELSVPHPVHESPTAWMFACRTLNQPGYPATPMLAASVVVPKDGSSPFHPSASDPLADLVPAGQQKVAARVADQVRRINARGCVVTVHSAIDGAQSTALPWQPSDEAPGWWARLTRRYFPAFEQVAVSDWDSVIRAVAEPGPDTRGLVWVRRELGGAEATGNLLYAHNHKGQVVFLDAQVGGLAKLDPSALRELVLMRAVPRAHPRAGPGKRRHTTTRPRSARRSSGWTRRITEKPNWPIPHRRTRSGEAGSSRATQNAICATDAGRTPCSTPRWSYPGKQPLRSAFPTPTHGPGCNAGTPARLPDPRDSPSRRLPVTRHGSNPRCQAWGPCSPRPNTRTGQQ